VTTPSLRELGWLVARDVNRTVGGGALELMRRSLARRQWIDERGHGVLVAVSRFTPGTNLLAYCAALGWTCHGPAGAVVATMAGSLPGAAIVAALTAAAASLDRWPAVRAALVVATLVAGGLVLASAWALVSPYLRGSRKAWTVASIALAAAVFLAGATPVRVLLAAAIWGALTPGKEPS
jgi:chromate transporter